MKPFPKVFRNPSHVLDFFHSILKRLHYLATSPIALDYVVLLSAKMMCIEPVRADTILVGQSSLVVTNVKVDVAAEV